MSDMELLRRYAFQGSEEAFAVLVARHVNLLYSAALRKTGNPHAAEEITQAVFVILAKKARSLRKETILSGWLYQATRLTAASFLRGEIRRARREQEAYMQSLTNEPDPEIWPQITPLLEDAIGQLSEKDRNAVVLRFFEGKSFQEIGAAFGDSENAVKKRLGRAQEKLRGYFSKRGIVVPTAVLTAAITANSVKAAPLTLAKTATGVALSQGAASSGSSLTLVKGALKLMAWTKAKMVIVTGVSVLIAAGTATVAVHEANTYLGYQWQVEDPSQEFLAKAPPLMEIRPTKFPKSRGRQSGISDGVETKRIGVNQSVEALVRNAYNSWVSDARTIYETSWPKGSYDYIDTVPKHSYETFRKALADKFGIVATNITRETNVLLLVIKTPNAPVLVPSAKERSDFSMSGDMDAGECSFTHATLANFAGFLEVEFAMPVLDRTGNTNWFDFAFKWKSLPRESDQDGFKRAMLDKLGLELVPSMEPIEMLVVKKAR